MLNDLKFALRRLRHAPGFTAIAILTIAVAVGANTAILSIADAVLFRPLPYQDADRVFVMMMRNPATGGLSTSVPDAYLRAIDERHGGLSRMGTYQTRSIAVQDPDGVRAIRGLRVSHDFFDILGVDAARGRLFAASDLSDFERPAVLSYSIWQARFGGAPGIVGRQITLGASTFDVIGVLPAQFIFPANAMGRVEVVTLLAPKDERARAFYPIFRLESGVTRDQAQAEISALIAPIKATKVATVPWLADLRSTLYPAGGAIMQFLLAAAGLVLLLGCANLANLLLARARTQERETALRSALGGSRSRIVRAAILEALMIAFAGASIAVIVNVFTFDALLDQVPRVAYLNAPVGVSSRVMALSFALALTASLLFAALPIWRTTRAEVLSLLRRGAERQVRTRLGAPMVAAQVAIAVVLLFGAAMAMRAFLAIVQTPLGFDPMRVVALNVPPPRTPGEAKTFYRAATDMLARVPGVVSAGATAREPLISGGMGWSMIEDPSGTRSVSVDHAMPGYLETLGAPLLRGRLLTWDDATAGRAMVLSESASRSLFGSAEALGRQLTDGNDQWEVVGVVGDIRMSFSARERPNAYTTGNQQVSQMRVNVRVNARSRAIEEAMTAALRPLTQAAVTFDWWEDGLSAVTEIKNPRFQTIVLTSFAGVAVGLTALGLFGLVSFLVASRTREFGVRIAIGASPRSLVALTMRQMFWPVAIGLVTGLLATRLLATLAEAQLFKVETRDPATLALASVVVLVSAMIAAYLPARRAERIDPIVALRTE